MPAEHRQRRHAVGHSRTVRSVCARHQRQHHRFLRVRSVPRRHLCRRRRWGLQAVLRRHRLRRGRRHISRHLRALRRRHGATSDGQDLVRRVRARNIDNISGRHNMHGLPCGSLHAAARRAVLHMRISSGQGPA